MKKNTKYLVCLMIVFGITSGIMTPPGQLAIAAVFDSDALREHLLDFIDAWQLTTERDQGEYMNEVRAYADTVKKFSPSQAGFNWHHTFNFTNNPKYFGPLIMEPEEVGDNLRNYMFQLLYSDIQAACEVSVLDIMLTRVFDSLIIDWLDLSAEGFCGGFSQAARDYYNDPAKIPLGRNYAHLLPDPDPDPDISEQNGGDVSEAAIKEYVLWKGSAAFFNPNHLLNFIKIFLGIPGPQGGITNSQELQKITQAMLPSSPHYTPVVVLLAAPCWESASATSSHFVTAIDYESLSDGSIKLYIYDNRERYDEDRALYDDWILFDPEGNFQGTHVNYNDTFSRISFYPETSEYNSILTALMDLLPQVIGMGIFSPVDIAVTDPLGRTISIDEDGQTQYEFPALMAEHEGEKQLLFPFAPGLPYTINLTGTDVGEYRMEANRVVDGQIVTENVTGETEPGQNDVFTVTLDEAGISIAEIGVYLEAPTILSGSAVGLEWSQYEGSDPFEAYEVYYSEKPNELGTLYSTIEDVTTTSTTVGGLTGETTYFFSVRVVTSGENIYDSNKVGATLPEDFTLLLYLAVGIGGFAVLLLVIVVFRRRRTT